MKKNLLIYALGVLMFMAGCSKNEGDDGDVNPTTPSNTVEVTGDITTATTWSADKIYLLKGNVFVTNNVTLTIQPGTIIKGDKATKGALIITRGAKIMAVGTVDKPIVFTSNIAAGGRAQGDWGGLIILGRAKNNLGTSVPVEGISDNTDKARHGGDNDADNSGSLKYVRVEYSGIAIGPDNELNGITFGSVGSGTTVEYVQVYRSGDDAFEWFGGSVNGKYLLAVATWDDDFDTDNGFSGKIQFALAQRLANTADVSGSNGFESDNNSNGAATAPRTSATFSNVTILGPVNQGSVNANYQHGMQIRRGSAISVFNSVIAGYTEGVFFDDAAPTDASLGNSSSFLLNGTSIFSNNLIYGSNGKSNQIKASNATTLALVTTKLLTDNTFDAAKFGADLFKEAYKYSADVAVAARVGRPDFTLTTNSLAANGAVYTNAKVADAFFEKVAFKGAFGTTDWTAGWAHFDPQTLPYTTPGSVK